MPGRVLVLAGTSEARALLTRCAGLDVEASLAGRTQGPDMPGRVRIGGFGGEAGFRASLPAYSAVLDATHPFAATMSERAARLCAETSVPYLRLTRAPWPSAPDWQHHPDMEACAAALPRGARVLLTSGPGSLAPFLNRDLRLWCRRIDPAPDCPGVQWVLGRPGDETAETGLLRALGAEHLVTKNSGGAGFAKMTAARALGVCVHVIDRPVMQASGPQTHDLAQALAFVRTHAHHHL